MSDQKQEDINALACERVVPDAIHDRMTEKRTVFCSDCNKKIPPNPDDIDNHFYTDTNHPSTTTPCVYCHGKVFKYSSTVGFNKPKVILYHRCTHKNEK